MSTDTKSTDAKFPPELTALASQACDIWQDYLTRLSADPSAKAELGKWMDPAQHANTPYMQMMAAFAQPFAQPGAMMQTGAHAEQPISTPTPDTTAQRPAPAAAAPDDGALRMAQLALRVAELERRIGELESEPVLADRPRAAKPA